MSTEASRLRVREWHRQKYHDDPEWAARRNENAKRWTREQKVRGLCTKCTRPATHKTVCEEHHWRGRENNWRKRGISITLLDFFSRVISQGYRCPLCRRDLDPLTAAVDHCHETGEVRGVLCIRCNCAIGALGDNAASLARVVEYLSVAFGGRK